MIKTLLAFSLTLASTAAFAQIPTLTSTINPLPGDKIPTYLTDTFDVGSAGTATTWHFNTLHHYSTDTLVTTTCSATSHCSSFPGANIATKFASDPSTIFYYNTTATSLAFVGGYYTSVPLFYNNSEDVIRYPFTYSSSFVDTLSSSYSAAGHTYHRWGTKTVTADAYGTLILPYGTFPNALRVKSIRVDDDTDVTAGTPIVYHYNDTSYSWYVPGYRSALLTIDKLYTNGGLTSVSTYYTIQALPNAIAESMLADAAVQLYPVPANEGCTIHCDAGFEANAYVEIVGIDGRSAARYSLQGTNTVISLSHLAPGLYTCRIFNKELQVKKLVIAR